MEGLDLFTPSLDENTRSDSSDSEQSSMLGEEPFLVDVEGDKDFEIEKVVCEVCNSKRQM